MKLEKQPHSKIIESRYKYFEKVSEFKIPFSKTKKERVTNNIAGKNNPPSEVYKHNGKYYINDGNHRVLADLAAGKSTTKARVIDTAEVKAAAKRMWAEKI